MPYQDVDEVTSEPTRTPSGVERIFRRVFVEDWTLKLLSLAITVTLWLVVTGQNKPLTTHAYVQLNFIKPQSLEISNDPPKTVDVTLVGSRNKLDKLSAPDLIATIDLTDQRPGERMIRLSERAQLSLPNGVRATAFSPTAIPIQLEPVIEKQVPVEPKISGTPADGYEIYSMSPNPATVNVRGPASHLTVLGKLPTETIWLAGQKESFTAANVAIDISDVKVEVLDPSVNVQVAIGERRIEKTFSNVPVVSQSGMNFTPRVATVTISGPGPDLERLNSDGLKVVLNDKFEPRVDVPSVAQGAVVLKSISPSKFNKSTK
jgi:YbbR domain-containing protein